MSFFFVPKEGLHFLELEMQFDLVIPSHQVFRSFRRARLVRLGALLQFSYSISEFEDLRDRGLRRDLVRAHPPDGRMTLDGCGQSDDDHGLQVIRSRPVLACVLPFDPFAEFLELLP